MAISLLSDAELWTLVVNDNYRAFTVLFQRHWQRMYKTALKYLPDEQASEEVIHDLFLNIWNRRAFLVINNFEAYLKASTRYQVYSYLKKHKTAMLVYSDHITDEIEYFEAAYADSNLNYQELEYRLNNHLSMLPIRCREVFTMSRMQHFTILEIASKLGINKRTVENHLSNALQSIKTNLKNIL